MRAPAGVAKSAYALDLKSGGLRAVRVRSPPPAPRLRQARRSLWRFAPGANRCDAQAMNRPQNEWSWRPWTWTANERIWIFSAILVALFIFGAVLSAIG